ncbi:MAG TPA: BREX system ATP-binding protein BrxD [Nakamurella sp.]
MTTPVSARRRKEVLEALRRGTVPANGLDLLAVGLDQYAVTIDDELDRTASGAGGFKAIRGDYGSGKTFFTRWFAERARRRGMATAEIQISETETPLHRLETVYRRIAESLTTSAFPPSAMRPVLDAWLYTLEEDAAAGATAPPDGEGDAVEALLERRLATVATHTPVFAQALRAYRRASLDGDAVLAEGLLAWVSGQPQVAASVKRQAGIRGELDHFGALGFLQGLLAVLRDSGHPGLVVVLDEVETLQRVRGDVRDKALNALRQLIDEVDSGRFPGLYLVITGTPAFFDGPSGVPRLLPLAARLATDFTGDPRFDNPRAVQIRLHGFDQPHLVELGARVRDLFVLDAAARVPRVVDDAYLRDLAFAVAGPFGDKVGVAPRLYLKKLLVEVLDKVDLYDDFDPRRDYALKVSDAELTDVERAARAAAQSVDDVRLDLP